jgi:(S)-ureidoglycine aminohydrolase
MKPILLPVLLILAITARAQSDTLTVEVCEWNKETVTPTNTGESRQVLHGNTHDLSLLNIRAMTLNSGQSTNQSPKDENADELIVVREGNLTITSGDNVKRLGPGGVAVFSAGIGHDLANKGAQKTTYYLFRFQSRLPENKKLAVSTGKLFLVDWPEMIVQQTAKGETRQIFNLSTPWLTKIDLHATTLNPGEVSHPPHVHRSEEIILLRSGHVQMYINGQHYPAAGGDLVFLSSGIPHALENKGTERCEYFALQWQP